MHPVWELWFVLFLIYLSECWVWVPRGYVACGTRLTGKLRECHCVSWLGNDRGALAFAGWLPCELTLRLPLFEFSLADGRICRFLASSIPGRSTSTQTCWTSDRLNKSSLRVVNGDLWLNSEHRIRTAHGAHASWLSKSLNRYLGKKGTERALVGWVGARLDTAAFSRDWSEIRSRLYRLRWLASLEFMTLFVGLPALFWWGAAVQVWLILTAMFVILHMLTVLSYIHARRRIHPEDPSWRLSILAALAPTYAMRTPALLSLNSMVKYHPVTVLAACGYPHESSRMLESLLRDLRFPPEPAFPVGEQGAQVVATFRRVLESKLEQLGKQQSLDLATVYEPPVREGGAASFCPRCHAQFSHSKGCHHCGGRQTLQFESR